MDPSVETKVRDILEQVKLRRFEAVKEFTEKFDQVKIDEPAVSKDEIEEAFSTITKEEIDVIKKSIKSVERFCLEEKKLIKDIKLIDKSSSTILRWLPLRKAGIYAPSGRAPLPSSVIMSAVPAKIAGVKDFVLCSPPQKDGKINKYILAAARLSGIDKIYKIGGAQAIGAMAYLFDADIISGPGNLYVSVAKQLVQSKGICKIDVLAGPSEVLVIADETANPSIIASDMLAQAEHGPTSAAICLTNNKEFAKNLDNELNRQIDGLDEITKKSIQNYGTIVITKDIEESIKLANEFAAEHVEIFTRDAEKVAEKIINAGAVFIKTGEVFGDYGFDSSNHILPTGRASRFEGGVSVQTFMKKQYVKTAKIEKQKEWAKDCAIFARMERLEAHARSAQARKGGTNE
ncbi:MAG TPA: histidinol dehydrogenase [Candidatus Bilamarchaeaceae archaeon]|nr:histidinol dehydrogenase [Candidatus Bilamarchaeaceae archaeon]